MTAAPDPKDFTVRALTRQPGRTVMHNTSRRQARVWTTANEWCVEFAGVTSRHPRCLIAHDPGWICPWPIAACFNGNVEHLRYCHGWHAPRAVVAAASLLLAADMKPITIGKERKRPR